MITFLIFVFVQMSIHQQKLAKELKRPGALEPPPAPPPRPAGTTFARPSIPLPKLERAGSPSSRSGGKRTDSPDKSHLLSKNAESPNINPPDSRRLQVSNPKQQHGTDASAPKNFAHQKSMPEYANPPPEAPRKFSLPTTGLHSAGSSGNLNSVIEEDESGTKQTPSHVASKPRRKTEGLDDELKKVIQQKAESLQSGFNKDTGRVSPAFPKYGEQSKSDTSLNSLSVPPKLFKKQPVVPSKFNK